jgi:hypothetical protein
MTTKTDPLADALLRLVSDAKRLETVASADDQWETLFLALTSADHKYRAVADRPHSLDSFRGTLESRAIELHRDYGVVLSIHRNCVSVCGVDL